jgi:SAM-dependent methyltransferase
MLNMKGKHLDLGCGPCPRNPYGQSELYGVDIRANLTAEGVRFIAAANLAKEPIPFASQHFGSVSAYDFLEHVPRVNLSPTQGEPVFPFIELLNEIWRVLEPGGKFYAVFPAYPHPLAFCDPTHVNILTDKSHRYFTGPNPMARMYGFKGEFELIRQHRIHPRGNYHPQDVGFKLRMKSWVDGLMGRRSHLVWEFKALPLATDNAT